MCVCILPGVGNCHADGRDWPIIVFMRPLGKHQCVISKLCHANLSQWLLFVIIGRLRMHPPWSQPRLTPTPPPGGSWTKASIVFVFVYCPKQRSSNRDSLTIISQIKTNFKKDKEILTFSVQ